MVWPVSGRGKQLFHISLLGDATLNIEKLKAIIIESTLVQQKITALYCKIYFVFALIDKANNYITCHRSCCSNFFTVVPWNVTFLGFIKTCKFKKSVDYNKKVSLLKKGVISYTPKVWLGFCCYFLFI